MKQKNNSTAFSAKKSIIALSLAAQMLFSSVVTSPGIFAYADEGAEFPTASGTELLEEDRSEQEYIEPGDTEPGDTEPGDTEPGDTEPGDTEPGDTEPGDTEPEGSLQETPESVELHLSDETYSGTWVLAEFGAEAGLFENTALAVREAQPPLNGEEIVFDGEASDEALHLSAEEQAEYERLIRETLPLAEGDLLFKAVVLDLGLHTSEGPVFAAAPAAVTLRLGKLAPEMAPYVSAICFDQSGAFVLGTGFEEDGEATLRFDAWCPERIALCVSAWEIGAWEADRFDAHVYGPVNSQLAIESAEPTLEGMTALDAVTLKASTPEGGAVPGLWVDMRPVWDTNDEITPAATSTYNLLLP